MINLLSLPHISQLLVVISPDWNAIEGKLYCFQRNASAQTWELVLPPIPIVLGKKGMAWGRGVQDFTTHEGPHKVEGDGKSPAGLFYLGTLFGDAAHRSSALRMPYMLITEGLEWVDDPHSLYYNQCATLDACDKCDWKSSEKMDEEKLYALGGVIEHNTSPIIPGKGSAIFLHIWRHNHTGTAGCTAMQEGDLSRVTTWLDCAAHPSLLQLPLNEYESKKLAWGLPQLP